MQTVGYKIIPVNPMIDEVLGEKAYNYLLEIKSEIDIINVFRRSEFVLDVAKEALQIKQINQPVFWTQQGVINENAYDKLKENNFTVIMDVCIKVAHAIF